MLRYNQTEPSFSQRLVSVISFEQISNFREILQWYCVVAKMKFYAHKNKKQIPSVPF